ncbi:reprolysin-like metallopeptidase [Niastella sp. OAS944]|uniref:reprolysin-like metallopeptidase n=1 Tax=Niastella sp. OAS944 TaxID=2664089 RepID=UPI00347AD738|nr:hypothetical protein [Chitinophagaceae bacterium OAS944]
MRRLLLSLATLLPILHATAQDGLWSPVSKDNLKTFLNGRSAVSQLPTSYELVKLNRSQLQLLQNQAPLVKPGTRSTLSPVRISVPLPIANQSISSAFTESPILSDALAKQMTGFKTYELKDPVTRGLQGRLSVTAQGVTGLIFTEKGTAYIYPVSPDYPDVHMVHYVKDIPFTLPVACGTKELVAARRNNSGSRIQTAVGDCQLRTYRLAVAATGEYTAWAGNQTQALNYIGITVNDVNTIYQRDAAITFTLVSNSSTVYTDATTDPYNTGGGAGGALTDNHNTMNAVYTSGGYDLGIVFHNGWNGGVAALQSTCYNPWKGMAAAGLSFGNGANPTAGPQGPIFVNTVAHEMAHQFDVQHTMSSITGGCGGNENVPTSWEPGGGSTIMAYAGVCSGTAYQTYSDLYFHGGSILQMMNYAINFATCGTISTLSNTAPTVTVPGTSYTIPVSTPFMLTATGADANHNTLYYNWEQMDADTSSFLPSSSKAIGPLFRSFPYTTSSTRVFPNLAAIISGSATPYEVLPSVNRALNFMVLVRDAASGGGCTAQESVVVNTNASGGAFTVTSQTTASSWTANGSNTATISWNVANTTAAPVSCSNVDIILSTDGGVTFTDTLAKNTANDGTENIIIPNLPTTTGRIMVKARGNIFFNVNAAAITITSTCIANGATITPGASVTGVAGNSVLDLSLSPVFGSPVTISGSITAANPSANLTLYNTSTGTCSQFSNVFQYQTFQFTPTATGSYTFSYGSGSAYNIFNLYTGNFVPASPCTGFINSSGWFNPPSSANFPHNYTATLTVGQTYTMAVGTFDTGSPTLPSAFSVSVSGPGTLLSGAAGPGAGFSYTYVIVDNATGLIKAFDASSDLSNATNYPVGTTYSVYGLSYSNAIAASLNAYVGGTYTAFRNALLYNPTTLCGNVSANSTQVTITAVLSSQLLPLTAYKNGTTVKLKWATTASEKISYFEIWRSANNSTFDQLVGTVAAQNGSARFDYELNDNSPLSALNYYRVKQVDADGTSTLGNIAHVNMQQPNATVSIYPNPVKSSFTLTCNANSVENLSVRIFNSKGSLVYQSSLSAQTGVNQYTVPANTLAQGIYVVQVVSSAGSYTERFIKE